MILICSKKTVGKYSRKMTLYIFSTVNYSFYRLLINSMSDINVILIAVTKLFYYETTKNH